jgi:hypothetical protein
MLVVWRTMLSVFCRIHVTFVFSGHLSGGCSSCSLFWDYVYYNNFCVTICMTDWCKLTRRAKSIGSNRFWDIHEHYFQFFFFHQNISLSRIFNVRTSHSHLILFLWFARLSIFLLYFLCLKLFYNFFLVSRIGFTRTNYCQSDLSRLVTMTSSDKKSLVDTIVGYRPPPVTKESAINFYAPAFGTLNYTFLSLNVMNPRLLQR